MIIYLENMLVATIGTILTFLFAPLMVLFASQEGLLPGWLAWAGQEDNTLDGDIYWQDPAAHPWVNARPRYVRRVLWLWRNPAQVLDAYLGAVVPANSPFTCKGNPLVSDQPHFVSGWCYVKTAKCWMFYACYPTFPGCCVRVYIGWKLMDFIHNPAKGDAARLTFGCNPFMTRGNN